MKFTLLFVQVYTGQSSIGDTLTMREGHMKVFEVYLNTWLSYYLIPNKHLAGGGGGGRALARVAVEGCAGTGYEKANFTLLQ